jgi:anti-anti-sigma factor
MAGAEQHRREGAQHGDDGPAPTAQAAPRVIRHLRSGLSIRMADVLGRTRMTVRGEIDLDCAETLYQALTSCLADTPSGVDVDLAAVDFFDCAGLNVLLRARSAARARGAQLCLTAMSPAVARLLDLTRCREAFPLTAQQPAVAGAEAWPEARPA